MLGSIRSPGCVKQLYLTWECCMLLSAPGSSHLSVNNMILENTGFKPQTCFDFNLWWFKKKYLMHVNSLNCTFLRCKDGLWSLISTSGTVRLENVDVLVPRLLSSKKRKCNLIAHSPWLWYNSFKLPVRTHWTLCSAEQCLSYPICGAASAQPQLRCSCAAWRVAAKPLCSTGPLTGGAEMSFHGFCVPGVTHPALFLSDRISVELCQGLSAPWQWFENSRLRSS